VGTDERLTAGDVCAVTGVPPNTLDRWTVAGMLNPTNFGRGTGRHRAYSVGDAVAVAAGMLYRRAGAGDDRVVGVVRFLADLGIVRLREHLAVGRTLPVPGLMLGADYLPGLMIDPRKDLGPISPGAEALLRRIDRLPAVVKDVEGKIERLFGRTAKAGGR
jgi:hypothetical protein